MHAEIQIAENEVRNVYEVATSGCNTDPATDHGSTFGETDPHAPGADSGAT